MDPLIAEYFVHALRNIIYTDLYLLQVKYKVKVESIYRLKYFLLVCNHAISPASNCGISPLAY